jgi:hypothetical protein
VTRRPSKRLKGLGFTRSMHWAAKDSPPDMGLLARGLHPATIAAALDPSDMSALHFAPLRPNGEGPARNGYLSQASAVRCAPSSQPSRTVGGCVLRPNDASRRLTPPALWIAAPGSLAYAVSGGQALGSGASRQSHLSPCGSSWASINPPRVHPCVTRHAPSASGRYG